MVPSWSSSPLQCPYCDLVFTDHAEITDHVIDDHPDPASSVIGVEVHELPHD